MVLTSLMECCQRSSGWQEISTHGKSLPDGLLGQKYSKKIKKERKGIHCSNDVFLLKTEKKMKCGWVAPKRRPRGKWFACLTCFCTIFLIGIQTSVEAIVEDPSPLQVEEAVKRGEVLAQQRQPPTTFYTTFGNQDTSAPHGFFMTKLGGVAVMSGHFALRGTRPSREDISRILSEEELQIVVTVFGDSPDFARGSYLLLKQGDRLIKPTRIRADGQATSIGPLGTHPAYRAKIVASFGYGTFIPDAETIVSVFPGVGGEVGFMLDFSRIP